MYFIKYTNSTCSHFEWHSNDWFQLKYPSFNNNDQEKHGKNSYSHVTFANVSTILKLNYIIYQHINIVKVLYCHLKFHINSCHFIKFTLRQRSFMLAYAYVSPFSEDMFHGTTYPGRIARQIRSEIF